MVVTFTDLGSTKHQTDDEILDGIKICEAAMQTHKAKLSSIAVDNAARKVAGGIADHFRSTMYVVVSRDPSHCVDLLSKDLAQIEFIQELLEEATQLHKFVRTDRIDSIRIETVLAGELDESYVGMTLCDTRMNLAHDYILGALKQSGFIAGLSRNELWKSFMDSRKAKDKLSWEFRLEELNDNKRYDIMH